MFIKYEKFLEMESNLKMPDYQLKKEVEVNASFI